MKISSKIATLAPSATLSLNARAAEMVAAGDPVISLAVGEPDFSPPAALVEAAHQALRDNRSKYTPAPGLPALRQALAQQLREQFSFQVEDKNIVLSAGGKQALHNVFEALLEPGDEVLLLCPWWVSYPSLIQLAGGIPVEVPMPKQGFLDFQSLEKSITKKTRLLVLNSPSNPSGQVITKEELDSLEDFVVSHDLLLVSDELYSSLVYGAPHLSPGARPRLMERTATIGGFSKCYAITGWRLGYSVTSPEVARAIASYQSHTTSNASSIAQYAVLNSLDAVQEDIEKMRRRFDKRRQLVVSQLKDIKGIDCPEPKGAFYVFPNVEKLIAARDLGSDMDLCQLILQELKIAVVPGSAFGASGHFRFSYAVREEALNEAIQRLKDFFE